MAVEAGACTRKKEHGLVILALNFHTPYAATHLSQPSNFNLSRWMSLLLGKTTSSLNALRHLRLNAIG
jgi:hypothetical protein